MFEKSMNYVNWVLFIAAILATLLVSFRIVQGLITNTVYLGRLCNSQAIQPFLYWADLGIYSIGSLSLFRLPKGYGKKFVHTIQANPALNLAPFGR